MLKYSILLNGSKWKFELSVHNIEKGRTFSMLNTWTTFPSAKEEPSTVRRVPSPTNTPTPTRCSSSNSTEILRDETKIGTKRLVNNELPKHWSPASQNRIYRRLLFPLPLLLSSISFFYTRQLTCDIFFCLFYRPFIWFFLYWFIWFSYKYLKVFFVEKGRNGGGSCFVIKDRRNSPTIRGRNQIIRWIGEFTKCFVGDNW